jgi:predicted RNA-binding protein with PIN domain
MAYMIDGHNLIPKVPGLSLQDLDDEDRLIELLQEFCRMQRKKVEVYFDRAPAGQAMTRRYGRVTAHFVSQHSSADNAIRQHLERLGKTAKNWIVVSSDAAVQAEARAAGAKALPSEQFVRLLQQTIKPSITQDEGRPSEVGPDEIDEWLKLFGQGK